MRVIYNGPHPEVVVDEFDPETVIEAGKPVNVPDELGARLLEQDTWSDDPDDQSQAAKALRAEQEAQAKAQAEAEAQAQAEAEAEANAEAAKPQDDSTEGNS